MAIAVAASMLLAACGDSVSDLIKRAGRGDAAAQLEYARLLTTTGNGVDQDWNKAVEMLKLSSENGNPDAQWELGLLYEHGNHIAQDSTKAYELYRISADAGSPIGLYLVAHCYQHGIAVEEDHTVSDSLYAESIDALSLLAPQEDKYVLNFIGSAYYWGDGVKRDRKKAFEYYLTSAQKGNPETQCKVADCYARGIGTAKDTTEALNWYRKSAAQGYQAAINALQAL